MRSTGFITATLLVLGAAAAGWAQSATAPTTQPLRPPAQSLSELKRYYLNALVPQDNTRVSLDLQNLPIAEALRRTLQMAGKEFTLDSELPADRRVTLIAQDVKLSTALDLITEAGGVGWLVEMREGKPYFRVGKSLQNAFPITSLNLKGLRPEALRDLSITVPEITRQFIPHANNLYLFGADEERSTFHCPHCKGQTTMVRQRQQPKCTKCSRVFQKDWQFCPADGAKRPAAPSQWKFCPHCGKEVKPEKAAIRLTPPTAPDADAVELEVRRF